MIKQKVILNSQLLTTIKSFVSLKESLWSEPQYSKQPICKQTTLNFKIL